MKKFVCILLFVLGFFPIKSIVANAQALNADSLVHTIIKEISADVNGDGKQEEIILSGSKKEDSPFYENVKITVSDLKSGSTLYSVIPTTSYGFNPTIMTGDFTGDGVLDLFYGATSGGSGGFGYFYLYTFIDEEAKTLFDYENFICPYKAEYQNYYKIKVYNDDKSFLIDLSNKKLDYLDKLYKKGILKESKEANIASVNYVFPYFNSTLNVFSLSVVRRITGDSSSDLLGYLVNDYSYIYKSENCIKSFIVIP